MNSREFYDRVCLMRRLQKEYDRSKSRSAARRRSDIEREIDAEIARVSALTGKAETPAPVQHDIFGNIKTGKQ